MNDNKVKLSPAIRKNKGIVRCLQSPTASESFPSYE